MANNTSGKEKGIKSPGRPRKAAKDIKVPKDIFIRTEILLGTDWPELKTYLEAQAEKFFRKRNKKTPNNI